MMNAFLQDLRFGLRVLMAAPAFTAMAVLTLALGIGANSAIFSAVNAILLRPLPYRDQDRLVQVYSANPSKGVDRMGVSLPDFRDWEGRNRLFERMAAESYDNLSLSGSQEPEEVMAGLVTPGFFETLGVNPARGRAFLPEEGEAGADRVIVLSHGLWQRRFGGDPGLVGKTVLVNGANVTVVGIMPAGFRDLDEDVEMWKPLAFEAGSPWNTRGNHFLVVAARLKPGASVEQAQADMQSVAAQLEQEYKENAGLGAYVRPLFEEMVGDVRPALLILFGAVCFFLLIACTNIVNLLMARSSARQRELSLRMALGASRGRLLRQLLTESLLLALIGGALGLLLAYLGLSLIVGLNPENIPRLGEISIDTRVLAFALLVTLLAGVISGLIPALQSSKLNPNEVLKEGGRASTSGLRGRRTRRLLVTAEVTLTLILLICASLMLKSFKRLQDVDPGFNPENVLTATVTLPEAKYSEPQQVTAFFQQAVENVRQLPGVEAAAATSFLPLAGGSWSKNVTAEGHPAPATLSEVPLAQYQLITSDYFKAMGIVLLKGRYFTDADTKGTPGVVIINETAARRFWPGEDPVGKRLWLGPPENLLPSLPAPGFTFPRLTVVGVVRDVKQVGLDQQLGPEVYAPTLQNTEPWRAMYLVVRTRRDPLSVAGPLRQQVWAVDRDQPVANVKTMGQVVADSLAQPQLNTLLLGVFAALSLALAAVGIYGVVSYLVSQRTNEIGIRLALGAQPSSITRLVVRQEIVFVLIGALIGVAASLLVTRVLSSLLYGISPTDPLTFLFAPLLLILIAFLSSYIPARKASRLDPLSALRYE
jgi:putative ABC transport system permease protein